jgi:hypothetical protein
MIGLPEAPLIVLAQANWKTPGCEFVYVPPCTQIVSPGFTDDDWRAVCNCQGLA